LSRARLILSRCVRGLITCCPSVPGRNRRCAIQDDSIAWIANRALNSVTRLNYFTGDTTSVAAGVFPRAVVLVGSRVFVVNSNLVGGIPAGRAG